MFLQLGIMDYKFAILLIIPIFYQIRFRLKRYNEWFELFINYLSYAFSDILFLIVRYNTNKSGKETITTNSECPNTKLSEEKIQIDVNEDLNCNIIIKKFKEEKLKEKKKELCELKLFVISVVFIYFIPMLLPVILLSANPTFENDLKECSSIFFVILFYILFSRIFLINEIYNHQIFSLIILSICMIFIFASYIIEIGLNDFNKIIKIIFFALIFGFYALSNVLGKNYLILL